MTFPIEQPRERLRCSQCGSHECWSQGGVERTFPTLPIGLLDLDGMHAFPREHREKTKGKWIEIERLGGFCLLLKREVLERTSVLRTEKWSDLSLFDTDILSIKARQAGYTLACCRDLFIHHFGTRTFSQGAPAEWENGKETNRTGV